MARIVIIGGPKTGKSTLAAQMGGGRSSDEVMNLGWSESSEEVSRWLDQPGPWIVEGVAVPRALRKWRERNPDKPAPVDHVIHLTHPHEQLIQGQISMAKGIDTVLAQIMPWLEETAVVEER